MELVVAFLVPVVLSLAFLALPAGDRSRRSMPRQHSSAEVQTVDVLDLYKNICNRSDRADDV